MTKHPGRANKRVSHRRDAHVVNKVGHYQQVESMATKQRSFFDQNPSVGFGYARVIAG